MRETATAQSGAGIVTTRSKSLNPKRSPLAFTKVEKTQPIPETATASAGSAPAAPTAESWLPIIHA